MAMREYNAERELARMHLLLRRSYQDMLQAEEGNPITDLDLSSTEFELCNGKAHKDTSATYSRRRQLKYAMRTIEQWFDGAKLAKKDADESTLRPPGVPDCVEFCHLYFERAGFGGAGRCAARPSSLPHIR